MKQYIDEDNLPAAWGGKDVYEYSFKPENRENDTISEKILCVNGTTNQQNNNDVQMKNLNLWNRKVSEQKLALKK